MWAFDGEDCAGCGAHHGVAHAHDVDARDALADVGVDAFEIVEDSFLPEGPIFFEQRAAIWRGIASGQRPTKCPDGFVVYATEIVADKVASHPSYYDVVQDSRARQVIDWGMASDSESVNTEAQEPVRQLTA
jgi:hypothetical protein